MNHVTTLITALLGFLSLASFAAEESSGKPCTVGNPNEAAQLPAALQAAYSGGAREITIAPGTYMIPATGRSAIALVEWTDVHIHARGVTLVFAELAHRPFSLQRCVGVTLEGAVLRFASPAFTRGRIVAMGRDDQGDSIDPKNHEWTQSNTNKKLKLKGL